MINRLEMIVTFLSRPPWSCRVAGFFGTDHGFVGQSARILAVFFSAFAIVLFCTANF